ncbi:MAG: hypothetical protein V1921_05180 [Candidatus Altiarchaeota archaeon]
MTLNVYIDSDVMIASEIKDEQNHVESKKFMDYIIKSRGEDIKFFTSQYTFVELASAMIRRTKKSDKAYSLLYRVRNSWKKFINPLPPMEKMTSFSNLVDNLIETAIGFKTPAGDTIHAHTFAEYEMDYLITWNIKHFVGMRRKIKNIKLLTPTNVLKEFEKIQDGILPKKDKYILKETLTRLLEERNKLVHRK